MNGEPKPELAATLRSAIAENDSHGDNIVKAKGELAPYIDRIRRENKIEAERAVRLHTEAYAEAWRIAQEMGKADGELKKVTLFGSALPGRAFRSDSDIDLVISGGNRALLERVATKSRFPVDILEFTDARSAILDSIEKEGVIVYAAPEN
jgi:predicted nucleotidyltransferase